MGSRAQYNIGDAYYNSQEYDRAIAAYKRVLEQYPRSSYIIEAINGIQFAQLSAGGNDQSSEVLEEFLKDNPQTNTADQLRFRQAENLMQTGDYEAAIKEFKQYLRVTNSQRLMADAYMNLAEAYLQTNNITEAIAAFETVVNDFPANERAGSALSELGRISFEQKQYANSYEYYRKLSSEFPRFRQGALIGMGTAGIALGELERSKKEFNSVLSSNPGNASASLGLAKIDLAQKSYSDAEQRLSQIAASNTTEIGAEAQYLLGISKQDQGLHSEALEAFSKVNILYEAFDVWVSGAMVKSAESHIRLGNRGEALATLNTVVERYSGTEAAAKARALIQTLN